MLIKLSIFCSHYSSSKQAILSIATTITSSKIVQLQLPCAAMPLRYSIKHQTVRSTRSLLGVHKQDKRRCLEPIASQHHPGRPRPAAPCPPTSPVRRLLPWRCGSSGAAAWPGPRQPPSLYSYSTLQHSVNGLYRLINDSMMYGVGDSCLIPLLPVK